MKDQRVYSSRIVSRWLHTLQSRKPSLVLVRSNSMLRFWKNPEVRKTGVKILNNLETAQAGWIFHVQPVIYIRYSVIKNFPSTILYKKKKIKKKRRIKELVQTSTKLSIMNWLHKFLWRLDTDWVQIRYTKREGKKGKWGIVALILEVLRKPGTGSQNKCTTLSLQGLLKS